MMKRFGTLTAVVAVMGAMAVASSAHAGTITIDGITMPVGINPAGTQIETQTIEENVITGVGQTLTGVGTIDSIKSGLTTTWQTGNNGVQLVLVFGDSAASSNFKSSSLTLPTATTAGTILFQGGNAQYYVLPSSINIGSITGTGNIQTDIANIKAAGTLWLNAVAAPLDGSGDTLSADIPANSTLQSFANASGSAFFDMDRCNSDGLGIGAADGNLSTAAIVNPSDNLSFGCNPKPNGVSDAFFSETFSSLSTLNGYQVSGAGSVKANAIPEPGTLSIIGMGLLGFGLMALRLRRRTDRDLI